MRPVGKSYKSPAHLKAARTYYERHAEKLREKSRNWYYKNRDKCITRRKQWALDNPDLVIAQKAKQKFDQAALKSHLKTSYGITIAQRDELFAKNGGLCWICNKAVSEAVDHDHRTNQVRGALCRKCNAGIGLLGDNYDTVFSAALYLKTGRTF